MRGTTVPRKEQNKAFDEEIGQPGKRVRADASQDNTIAISKENLKAALLLSIAI